MILARTVCLLIVVLLAERKGVCQIGKPDCFPAVTQFSPVPAGKGWKGEERPLSEEILLRGVRKVLEVSHKA